MNFTQVTATLKITARQDILDKFMLKTYKNPNDYRTIILKTLRKGVMRTIEDKLIYGDVDNDAAEFDGLGHLLPADVAGGETFATSQIYDVGGSSNPISMEILRKLIDAVRPKPEFLLMTRTMRNTLSATAFEKGLVLSSSNPVIGITGSPNQTFGARIDFFDGIPIMISDYLLNETDNTTDKDPGNDSGFSSIWAIRTGSLIDGGVTLLTGGDTGGVEFFNMVELENLEDYDASGIRLVAYVSLAQGSTKATAVCHSIKEDQVIVG